MIFTVAEFRALQEIVDIPGSGNVPNNLSQKIDIAEAALRKVHEHTAWDTDTKYDVHKEPQS